MFRKVNLIAYFVICLKFSYALNWFNFGATGTKSRGCSVEDSTLVAKYFHKVKYDKSNCPTETWLSDFHLVDSNPSKLIIDVGFNKGYNFAGWMDGWTPELKVTRDVWFQEIMSRMPNQNKNVNCGMCGDCVRDDTIEYSELKHANYQDLRLIGLDLNQVNVQLVNEIMDAMKTKHLPENNYFGQIPQVHVVHAAGSSEDAWKDVMNCGKGTFEGCSIFDPKMHNEKVKSANKTAFLTVDTVYKTITKSLTHSPESPASVLNAIPKVKSRQPIDILLIDAEGYDADVLQGARRVIKKNLVRVIIFEYHKYCPWPKYSLSAIVERFADNNYVCYFEGQKRLWRLTGCWDPLWEIHNWSNVICVLETDPWAELMEKYRVSAEVARDALAKLNALEAEFPLVPKPDPCK